MNQRPGVPILFYFLDADDTGTLEVLRWQLNPLEAITFTRPHSCRRETNTKPRYSNHPSRS